MKIAPELAVDLQKLVGWGLGAGWLQPAGEALRIHPVHIEGLETAADEAPTDAQHALVALLEALMMLGREPLAVRTATHLHGRTACLPMPLQAAIDTFLANELLACEDDAFLERLWEAGRLARGDAPVLMLARALVAEDADPTEFGGMGLGYWRPPSWPSEVFQRIALSAEAERLARRYVRVRLVYGGPLHLNGAGLLEFLALLGWDLTADYVHAFLEGTWPANGDGQIALQGALNGVDPPYERLLAHILVEDDKADEWWESNGKADQERAQQGELDAEYAAHLIEEAGERFAPVWEAVAEFVCKRVHREGTDWLVTHPARARLEDAWASGMREHPASEVHWRQLWGRGAEQMRVHLIKAACRVSWSPPADEILDALPELSDSALRGVMNDELKWVDPERARAWAERVGTSLAAAKRVQLALAGREAWATAEGGTRSNDEFDALLQGTHERRVVELLAAVTDRDHGILSLDLSEGPDLDLLNQICTSGETHLASRALFVLAVASDAPLAGLARRLLQSDEHLVRQNVLRALTNESSPEARALIVTSLGDTDYRVRRVALELVASNASPAERTLLDKAVDDPSAPVREAWVRLATRHRWPGVEMKLVQLLRDTRNASLDTYSQGNPNHHVARVAAGALARMNGFTDEVESALVAFVSEGSRSNADLVVHHTLLPALGRIQSPAVLPLLLRCLKSRRWMKGWKYEGYPLRYAAAWVLVELTGRSALGLNSDFREALLDGANDADERLAAPSTLVLGLTEEWRAALPDLLGKAGNRQDELILLFAPPELLVADEVTSKYRAVCVLAASLKRFLGAEQARWTEFLRSNPAVATWLAALVKDEGVMARAVLHVVVSRLDNPGWPELPILPVRQHELAQSIPIMNLYTMTGGE